PPSDVSTLSLHDALPISMGNFVSNQRVETLGDEFARTEDGVIVHFTIEKNHRTDETTIENVDFIPTWVYKIINPDTNKPEYRIRSEEHTSELQSRFDLVC